MYRLQQLGGACAIDYSDQYPTTPFPRIAGDEDALYRKSVFSKSLEWKYENEFRLCSLRFEGNETWHLDLSWKSSQTGKQPQIAVVNPKTIDRLYIGARMPGPRRDELITFCRHKRPDIKILAGTPSAERYELHFTKI